MFKKFTFSLLAVLSCALYTQAQTGVWVQDSVEVGSTAQNDVYYCLPKGTVKIENNHNYVIAFGTRKYAAGVWINHQDTVVAYKTNKTFADWATISIADTVARLYNSDTSWDVGALNTTSSGVFDYGWGNYNTTTHNVYGDEIFIVSKMGVYSKIFIDSMDGITNDWTVHMSGINYPYDTVFHFSKSPGYDSSNFIYLGFGIGGFSLPMREPVNKSSNAWDMVFTNYMTTVQNTWRNTVGALHNYDVMTAKVTGVNPTVVAGNYTNYTSGLDTKINTIGYDWKTFDQANSTYIIDSTNTYIVKSKADSMYYLLKFESYSGGVALGGNGKIVFSKMRLTSPTAVQDLTSPVSEFVCFPNPANNKLSIAVNAKINASAALNIVDLNGRICHTEKVQLTSGLNILNAVTSELPAGNYFIQLNGDKLNIAHKIIIQH